MSIGLELRRARRAAGMTQERLAVVAKVDRTYISDLENNKQSPTVAMLFRLCDALGVRAAELLARVEATRTPPKPTPRTETLPGTQSSENGPAEGATPRMEKRKPSKPAQ